MSLSPIAVHPHTDQRSLAIHWSNGEHTITPYRTLRFECPCAGCVNEMTGERMLQESSIPKDIRITGVTALGRYALQFQWSDGHGTGLYHFDRLWQIAQSGSTSTQSDQNPTDQRKSESGDDVPVMLEKRVVEARSSGSHQQCCNHQGANHTH